MSEGKKFDGDKLRFDLIPPEVEEAFATILTFGATKYGDRNWELGMKWSRCIGALRRHINAWQQGEKLDPESGKSHLWHALACLSFLVTYEIRDVGENDITACHIPAKAVHKDNGVKVEFPRGTTSLSR